MYSYIRKLNLEQKISQTVVFSTRFEPLTLPIFTIA